MHSTPTSQPFPLNRRSLALALCLIAVLAGVYWLTYSGRVLSTDEMSFFDGVESLVRRGNTQVNLNLDYPRQVEFPVGDEIPAPLVDAEPLQLIAAGGLFRLAEMLPGVGLVHMVWLLNVLVCAAVGGVFFLLARLLGYTERVAIGATLILGLGTMLWPYSKVFFREPLAMLLLLGATLCLQATMLLLAAAGGLRLAGRIYRLRAADPADQRGDAAQPADLRGDGLAPDQRAWRLAAAWVGDRDRSGRAGSGPGGPQPGPEPDRSRADV